MGYSSIEQIAKKGRVDNATLREAKATWEKARGEVEAKRVAYRVALARVKGAGSPGEGS